VISRDARGERIEEFAHFFPFLSLALAAKAARDSLFGRFFSPGQVFSSQELLRREFFTFLTGHSWEV